MCFNYIADCLRLLFCEYILVFFVGWFFFFFQAEDGIRDLVRSRGLGDVYKRQIVHHTSDNIVSDGSQEYYAKLVRAIYYYHAVTQDLSLIHI